MYVKKDLYKRSITETNDVQESCEKRPTKETYVREKRPIKETYKRDEVCTRVV